MSDEYSPETDSAPAPGFKMDAFIPLVLLSISFIVLLCYQLNNLSTQRTQIESAISRQQSSVDQSKQLQAGLAKLATDLLQAAQTDGTAKAIADRFGIQQNATPAPSSP